MDETVALGSASGEPALSIIIVTYARITSLKMSLDSIYSSNLPADFEVIVIVNGKSEETVDFLSQYALNHRNLAYHSIEKTTFGGTRNLGIEKAQGRILYFIDDDVTVDGRLFENALGKFRDNPQVDLIGGPNLTPKGSSRFQRCCGYVLETYFGASSMRHRYYPIGEQTRSDERKLILCNLAVKASTLKRLNARFNDKVVSNEENILLQYLGSQGRMMLYCPDLIVYHERRADIFGYMTQVFKYGRGRMHNILHDPSTFSPVFLIPSLFLFDAIFAVFSPNILLIAPLGAYAILDCLSSAAKSLRERDILAFPWLMVLYPVTHFSYGMGFIYQIFKNEKTR
jgi:glycosyltransferase involved in cell wall biosynthesis